MLTETADPEEVILSTFLAVNFRLYICFMNKISLLVSTVSFEISERYCFHRH